MKALDDALGVIHTIDAHTNEYRLDAQFPDQRTALLSRIDFPRNVVSLGGEFDTNREREHRRLVIVPLDGEVLPVHPGFEYAIYGTQEVIGVSPNMEPDQIRAEQAIQQFTLPWADFEGLGIGPGNVPENRNPRVGQAIFHHAWQQSKMIVLDQHYWMFLARHFLH